MIDTRLIEPVQRSRSISCLSLFPMSAHTRVHAEITSPREAGETESERERERGREGPRVYTLALAVPRIYGVDSVFYRPRNPGALEFMSI